MSSPKPTIRIADARAIGKRLGADGVVVLAFVDGRLQGASYGPTSAKCKATGDWLDWIVDALAAAKLPLPKF